MPDADKPVAKLELDTRSQGPLLCDDCGEELEHVLLMEDGGVACPECRSLIPAFEQFSKVIMSAAPVKLKGAAHTCGDRCRERGCKYDFPKEEDEDA